MISGEQARTLRKAYTGLTLLFLGLTLVEVFVAGLLIWGRFQESDLEAHRSLANILLIIAVVLFALSLVSRMPQSAWALSLVLAVFVGLQGAWVEIGGRWIHALHPTMTFVIMALGNYLFRASRQTWTTEHDDNRTEFRSVDAAHPNATHWRSQ